MDDEKQVQQLLDEALDSERTPEEVCRAFPELLGEVSRRWRQVCLVDAELKALFPKTEPHAGPVAVDSLGPGEKLPRVPGYEVVAVLGRGGMGVVFQARHLKLNRLVALKMLLAGAYAGPLELERFRREAEAVAALRHPHIVQVYDVGDLEGHPYYTMEFVEGGSLAQRLATTRLSVRQAAELVAVLAGAVEFAHRSGVIHRDLKPGNILLTADGTPKIADFGLARRADGGPEFTLSGARLGTPSYMAPEQALGRASAIGPAVDVYALGAVLYELLAGRPPFKGQTAADIERQVIADDAKPPSRYNARVPRNLDNICLKCLHKNPVHRYAGAQDLADDLHRYLDGLPVHARPVGPVERAAKWARRRPALAALLLTLVVALASAVGVSVWLQQQRTSRQTIARGIIKEGIPRAYELGHLEQWRDAGKHLADVERHLVYADSDELTRLVGQAKEDIRFAEKLDHIRQRHALSTPVSLFRGPAANREWAAEYAQAFAEARFNIDDVENTAAKIRASEVLEPIVTALDLWALVAFREHDESLQARLLRIARLADPDPAWRDRFRDPAAWGDEHKLVQLADDAAAAPTPPAAHQLAIVSLCLHQVNSRKDSLLLLEKARRRRPRDYWLTWEVGVALEREKRYLEAVTYFRIVVAQRPESPWLLDRLSGALCSAGQLEDALEIGRLALDLEPDSVVLRHHLIVVLLRMGQFDEARSECRRILNADPDDAPATLLLGATYSSTKRPAEAIPHYRRALEIDHLYVPAWGCLGTDLLDLGRVGEAEAAFSKAVQLDPTYMPAHLGLSRIAMRLGQYEQAATQYQWLRNALEPNWAVARSDYNLDPKALRVELFEGLAVAHTWLGRDAQARDAVRLAEIEYRTLASPGKAVIRRLSCAKQLRDLRDELPAICAGKEPPGDVATRRTLAEWLYEEQHRTYAAARLYEAVFAKQPSLAEDLDWENRFEAACSAAQTSCGIGEDAGQLDDAAKTRLRKLALAWLTAERDAWEKRCHTASGMELSRIARTMLTWQQCAELACIRDADALAKLPEAEMKDWQRLWAGVKLLGSGDPLFLRSNGRHFAAYKDWAQAAAKYGEYLNKSRTDNSEVWFEYAAVQLLAGDDKGYRQTCQHMLSVARQDPAMRPYHAARASTLAPNSVSDPSLAASVSAGELSRFGKDYWSLTEQGALCYRAGRYKEAVPLLQQSLKAETRPGAAVLNWLWLAMAYQQLGEKAEARRWLDKATDFLDKLGDTLPRNGDALNLHFHNWLEAQILRREAEKLLAPPVVK